jgi:hypothetical protein
LFRNEDEIWEGICNRDADDSTEFIAVLRAYVDASTREDSGLISVAGYLMETGRVRRFRQQWKDTFGSTPFSWADLVARAKPFKYLRDHVSNTEHDRLIAAGVSLVREFTIAGTICSCWQQDVAEYAPRWIKGFGHPYSIAGHMALVGLGNWAKRNNYPGGIEYVIEQGDEGYDQLDHLLSYASKLQIVSDMYQWSGHRTAPKTVASPFHAPDLLAWEWGKFMDETAIVRKREMRLSLVALLNERLERYVFQHLSGDPLMNFFNQIHAVGVEQWLEDRGLVASVPQIDLKDSVETSEPKEPVGDPE